MFRHQSILIFALYSMLAVPPAAAFFDPPTLVPEHPTAGELVSVSIRGGECDTIIEAPGYPQITRNGDTTRILFNSVHNGDIALCNIPVGTGVFPVGTYTLGDYTLQVDRTYIDFVGNPVVETLGIIPFTVAGVGPASTPLPAIGAGGLIALFSALLGLVGLSLRQRCAQLLVVGLILATPIVAHAQVTPDARYVELLIRMRDTSNY